MTVTNYDSTLIGWKNLGITGRTLVAGELFYCNGEASRDSLITNYGWTITDGESNCMTSWMGFMNNDWFNSANWTEGVPTEKNIVIIHPSQSLFINSEGAIFKTLLCEPGSIITIGSSGELTIKE